MTTKSMMDTSDILPEEQEAAQLLLAQLRQLLPAVKGEIIVGCFSGNDRQQYSHDRVTRLKGGGYFLYGALPERETHGDQNRGDFTGTTLVMDAQGQLWQWLWAGEWSQWQAEASEYYPRFNFHREYPPYVESVGLTVGAGDVLECISLDELAKVVAKAEEEAEVNRHKRTERLTARSKRAQEIIRVLKGG